MWDQFLKAIGLRERTVEEEYGRNLAVFWRTRERQGRTTREILNEIRLREAFIGIRRKVSAKTMQHPAYYDKFLAEEVKSHGDSIKMTNKKLAFAFIKMMGEMRISEILTPEAYKVWGDYINSRVGHTPKTISQDAFDALKMPL